MIHPPIHLVSIRLCEDCMEGWGECDVPGCALYRFSGQGVTPLDTSPPLSAFYVDPATGEDTRTGT